MNIANMLTLFRFVVTPIIGGLLLMPSGTVRFFGFILFLVAILSDFADGFVARLMGMKSDLGRDLDPLADKFLTAFLSVVIVAKTKSHPAMAFAVALIIVRDILVTGLRSIVGGGNIPVTLMSKTKTFFQFVTITLTMMFMDKNPLDPSFSFMMCLSAFLSWFSAVEHIKCFISSLKKKTEGVMSCSKK